MKFDFFKTSLKTIDYSFFPNVFDNSKKVLEILKKEKDSPVFLVDTSIVKKRLKLINKSLRVSCPNSSYYIAYSFKTNYDIAQNMSFQIAEVVSEFELKIALKQKYKYDSIIFNGPNKGNLKKLLGYPITINIDNFSELNKVISYKNNIKAKIGIRVSSSFYLSRFGFNMESGEASKAILLLKDNHIPISGLHLHIGSDIHESSIYKKHSLILKKFIENNFSFDNDLKYIDFGGGFPSHGIISETCKQSNPDINEYVRSIVEPIRSVLNKNVALILEPGRYLSDDSTVLISKIIDVKRNSKIQSVIVDSTINMLPTAWYHQLIVKAYSSKFVCKSVKNLTFNTKIYGCTCQESDLLYQGKLSGLTQGDYIVFFGVGAYNQSQAANFIFKKPKAIFI